MSQKPTLLITGANGFTGEHACRHFSKCGYEIIAATKFEAMESDSIKIEHCDLTNKKDVYQLIHKTQSKFLLHLAGMNHVGISWEDPLLTLESNLLSTLYLIEANRKFNPTCKILIIGSTLQSNLGDVSSLSHPYGLSKALQVLISQAWVKFYKMNIVVANPTNLIGPGKSNGINAIIAEKIAKMENNESEKVIQINNLNARIDFLDVRDVVSAYEILLLYGVSGEVYDISSGEDHSLGDLIHLYKNLTTTYFRVETLSDAPMTKSAVQQPTKLQVLGWKPAFTLAASVSDTLHYFRNQQLR